MLGLIQMTSVPDVETNIAFIEKNVVMLAKQGARVIVTPENAILFGNKDQYHHLAEPLANNSVVERFGYLAKTNGVWLIIGSMPVLKDGYVYTTSVVISSSGELVEHYDKLHMFDVTVNDAQQNYRESDTFNPGNEVKTVQTPIGLMGLSICYDLRFPSLYSQLRDSGADIIIVPAAFTAVTGKAHWEVLLRARAIETQCWIVAVNQTGTHFSGRETWGHSMVVSPWGDIVAQLECEPENLLVEVDLSVLSGIRSSIPVVEHQRFTHQLMKKKI